MTLATNIRVYDLTRTVGMLGGRRTFWFAVEYEDYFPWPLTADSFKTGPSDYDVPSDEIYCPCGDVIDWEWPHSVGGGADAVAEHIRAKHPETLRRSRR